MTEVAIIPTVPEINAEAETITSEAVNVALSKKDSGQSI
ncbi:MSHA biogenesis protein MshN [Shewanella putrefaciens]|nr:MSHA biogenesis protein MshN [Shewanella putrefaciens]